MIRICSACREQSPEPGPKCPRCGGDLMDVMSADEVRQERKPEPEPPDAPTVEPKKASELGATIGAMVSDGNPLAIAVGYLAGKLVEGKKLISFKPIIPDPPRIELMGFGLGKKKGKGKGKKRKRVAKKK